MNIRLKKLFTCLIAIFFTAHSMDQKDHKSSEKPNDSKSNYAPSQIAGAATFAARARSDSGDQPKSVVNQILGTSAGLPAIEDLCAYSGMSMMSGGDSKATDGAVKKEKVKIKLADLPGGVPRDVLDFISIIQNPKQYKLGAIRHNLIFYGPPGTGKTTLAKFIADEIGAHFESKTASSFADRFEGGAEEKLKAFFERLHVSLKNYKNVVVFIDEVDRLIGSHINDSNGTTNRVLSALLEFFDQRSESVICILATNNFNKVPKELTTRFERQIFVDLPDSASRLAILEHLIPKNRICTDNLGLEFYIQLAEEADGLSRREICKLAARAFEICGHKKADQAVLNDFLVATYLIQESQNKLPNVINRRILVDHYLNDEQLKKLCKNNQIQIVGGNETLQAVARETEGFKSVQIESAIKKAFNLAYVKIKKAQPADKSEELLAVSITLNDFIAGIYDDHKATLISIENRLILLTYYSQELFNANNSNLSAGILRKLADQVVRFTGQRIKKFLIEAQAIAAARGSQQVTDRDLYVALYMEQSKDAEVVPITMDKNKNTSVTVIDKRVGVMPFAEMREALFRHFIRAKEHTLTEDFIIRFTHQELEEENKMIGATGYRLQKVVETAAKLALDNNARITEKDIYDAAAQWHVFINRAANCVIC